MAVHRLMQGVRALPAIRHGTLRYKSSTSSSETKERVLQYLLNNVSAVQTVMKWNTSFKLWTLKNKNERFYFTEALYGKNATAAYYTLEQRGGVRFKGHTEWFRPNHKGHYTWDFLQHKDVPVECVDLSGSMVTYIGLGNLDGLHELRELNLSRCDYIDDWALNRLHVFKDSLEVLSLAGCRQVTERGLATLHHLQLKQGVFIRPGDEDIGMSPSEQGLDELSRWGRDGPIALTTIEAYVQHDSTRNLKHLDLSDLPSVDNKGLVLILLEELLPACEIVGIDYTDGLRTDEVRPAQKT